MSDDADGAKRNVNSVHQKRSLFQVSNPFWPPVSHDSLLSTSSSTRAFRRRDGSSQYSEHTESFVVDIPVHDEYGDANNSTARSVTSDTEGSDTESGSGSASPSSGEELDTSANNSFLTLGSSDEATSGDSTDERRLLLPETGYDSDTSDFSDEDTDTETDAETTSVGDEVDSTAISDSLAGTSTGDEVDSTTITDETEITSLAEETEITSAGDAVGSISIGVEVEESGNYSSSYYDSSNNASSDDEQYSDEENVNINAKKEGGEKKDSKKGGKEGDDKKKKGGHKSRSSSKKGSKKKKKSKSPGKKGSKDKKKKGKSPKKKPKGDNQGKKTNWNNFFNIFSTESPYPPSVYFILGSEFCERFTYYGLRSILVMYLTSWLGIARNNATACFHIFSCLAYSSPIIGAIIADGYLGRYKTILYVSMVYTMGCIVLSISSFPPPQYFGPMLGLFLISVGTGGIKPCVVTFGGDQFPPDQVRRRATFFSTFYFIINIGSMLSTIITPVIRSDVHCVDESCYPLAFGVPAILMTLASLVFWSGRGSYKHVKPSGSLFSKTINCICYAMCGCCGGGGGGGSKKPKGKPKSKKGKKGKGKGKGKEKGKGKGKGKEKGSGKKKSKKKGNKNKNALSSEEDTNENKAKETEKKEEGDKDKTPDDKKDAKGKGSKKDKGDKKKKKGGKKDSKKGKKGAKKGGKKDKKAKKGPPAKGGKHWLDRAAGPYEPKFIEDVKRLTKLVWLFLPLPLFWALFNQQGSRWTLQAAQLDGRVGDFGRLKPDQMQALNPLCIILLIPVFERVVYPCINSCGIPNRALQRMVVGMMCSAGAFLLAALLQSKIDSLNEDPLAENNSGYTIINTVHCKIWFHGEPTPFFDGNIGPFGQTDFQRVTSGIKTLQVMCPTMGTQGWAQANLTDRKSSRLVITSVSNVMSILVLDDKREKSTNGTGYVSFLHLLAWVDEAMIRVTSLRNYSTPMLLKVGLSKATEFHVLEPGSYQIAFPALINPAEGKNKAEEWQDVGKPFEIGSGGVYTIAMIDPTNNVDLHEILVEKYVTVKENSLSMMLMIPQYIVMTVGEILFSISGLAFAYTQAPESMKSVIQACWLLTTSVGDLIVVLVAEVDLVPSQMAEFYLFSALMMADCIIFAIMTCFYSYVDVDPTKMSKKKGGKKGSKKGGKKGGKKGSKKGGKKGSKKGGKKGSKKKKGGKGSDKKKKKGEGDKEGGGEDKKKEKK